MSRSIFDESLPLGEGSQVYWRHSAPARVFAGDLAIRPGGGDPPISTSVIDGAGPTYPRIIRLRDDAGQVLINLSSTLDHDSAEVDEFTADAETNLRLCVQYKASRLVVAFRDDTDDPYRFLPSNADEVLSFVTAWKADSDNTTEPVKAAFVWAGMGSRVNLTDFTTELPVFEAGLTGGGFIGSARLHYAIPLAAGITLPQLDARATLSYPIPLTAGLVGGPLTAYARLRDPTRYARAVRVTAPEDTVLTALEIRHPAIPSPIRVVNDAVNRRIEGKTYIGLRFGARLADDTEGRSPEAEIVIDNVGRELMEWIEAADGGTGATVRVMQALADRAATPEWELTMDVSGVRADQEQVVVSLGYDPLLGRSAVRLRHDPQTSPGLF